MNGEHLIDVVAHARRVDVGAIEREAHRVSCTIWPGESVEDGVAVRYVRVTPGEGSSRGFHTHMAPQYFYVLSGELLVEIEGEEPVVAPADTCVVVPSQIRHRTSNANETPCTHLSIGG